VRQQLLVAADLGEVECSPEVRLCALVSAGVMGHPASHLGERCGGREEFASVLVAIATDQAGATSVFRYFTTVA
jgi:hypothetical protein